MQKEPLTPKSKDYKAVESLYKAAFPAEEQAPLLFLFQRAKKDFIEFSAYYDGEALIGIVYQVAWGNIIYIVYLAVDATIRSKGCGSKILDEIKESYPDKRILLNIEVADETADNNPQRIKRKQFYARNGFADTGVKIKMFGVTYDMLSYNGPCSAKEFLTLHKKFLGPIIYAFMKPKLLSQ